MDKVTVTDEKDGWEIFSDTSYFDMWCVRPVGEKRWGAGFHVVSRDGAEAARDYLIEATRQAEEAVEQRFWSIVDPNGVPSDMWEALERLAHRYRTARQAEEQIKLLREALEPVASVEFLSPEENYADNDLVMVSVGTVRAARQALEATNG